MSLFKKKKPTIKSRVTGAYESASKGAKKTYKGVSKSVGNAYKGSKSAIKGVSENTLKYITKHPYRTGGAIGGLGLLGGLGALVAGSGGTKKKKKK